MEPRELTVMYLNSTALELTWQHPLCDYGIRRGYTVSLQTLTSSIQKFLCNKLYLVHIPSMQITHDPLPAPLDPPGEQGMPGSPYNLTAGDRRLVITDLTPNTNYNITVCAFTSVGCGPLSSRVNQTDEDGKNLLKFAFGILYDCIHFLNSSPGSHQSGNHLIKKHKQ